MIIRHLQPPRRFFFCFHFPKGPDLYTHHTTASSPGDVESMGIVDEDSLGGEELILRVKDEKKRLALPGPPPRGPDYYRATVPYRLKCEISITSTINY